MNLGALEKYGAYEELLQLDYDEYTETMTDDSIEQERPEAAR